MTRLLTLQNYTSFPFHINMYTEQFKRIKAYLFWESFNLVYNVLQILASIFRMQANKSYFLITLSAS